MSALPCVFMLRGVPQLQALRSSQVYDSTPWTICVSRRIADIGAIGDEVLHLVFARIGNIGGGPDQDFGIRVRSGGWPLGRSESRWRTGATDAARPGPPWFMAGQTYSLAWRETLGNQLANGNCVEVQAKVAAASAAGVEAGGFVEDAVIVTFNLTRLASRGMNHAYVEETSEVFGFTNAAPVPAGPALAIPNAAPRTFLVIASGVLSPGGSTAPTQVQLRWTRDGVPWSHTEWLTTAASGPTPDNQNTPWANRQCFTFATVVQATPSFADAVQLFGIDGFAPLAGIQRFSRASGAVCAIDITDLRPDWALYDNEPLNLGLFGLRELYGPAPNKPNHGDYLPIRINGETGVPALKIALAWAVPLNVHVPGIVNSFALQMALQRDQQIPAVPRDLLNGRIYVQHRAPGGVRNGGFRSGGLPDYANAQFSTGRGPWELDLFGWFSPIHDVLDANLELRVRFPYRSFIKAGAVAFVTFDAVAGAQREVEPPTPVGATVYIDPGREGPAVETLPEFPWMPDATSSVEQSQPDGEMVTMDGRTITWGRVLRGRRRYRVTWTTRSPAQFSDHATGTRAEWDLWLANLAAPMVRWVAPEDMQPSAWVLLGPIRYRDRGRGVFSIEGEVVELVWVDV